MILEDILKILKKQSNMKAYTIGDESYTYSELYKFVCNLYELLLRENKSKKPIIVYGHKEIYMKACFLACSFAGMTYVPVDESMPKERIEQIINQINPSIIMGDFNIKGYKNINKKNIYDIINNNDYNDIEEIYLKPDDIYYIIFTSGSTGIPKGVKVTYKNLDSCIKWLSDITKISKGVILNQANFSFDLSVADLYLSLICESEHFIIEEKAEFDFNNIFKQLKNSNSTFAVMTPSFADLLMTDKSFGEEILPKLNTILFCGEKLYKTTVKKLYSRFNNINIINTYGPTECTFAVTSIKLNKNMNDEIPIGVPKKDVTIYILDKEKNELKNGEKGEILISGASVADGYIGNIENKSFIEYKGIKSYLTGDIGYIKNGLIYYEERKDRQIKYKGYRIELSDIEENLNQIKYIEKAIVTVKQANDNGKIKNILAFVKIKEKSDKKEIDIKNELEKKLPQYMIPKIKIIDKFPINQNGKCDIKKLMEDY